MLDVGVKVRQNTYKIPLQDITDIFNKILALKIIVIIHQITIYIFICEYGVSTNISNTYFGQYFKCCVNYMFVLVCMYFT